MFFFRSCLNLSLSWVTTTSSFSLLQVAIVRCRQFFAAERDLTSTVELNRMGVLVLSLEWERVGLETVGGLLGSVAKRRTPLGRMLSIVLKHPSYLSLVSMAAYFLSTFCLSSLSTATYFSISSSRLYFSLSCPYIFRMRFFFSSTSPMSSPRSSLSMAFLKVNYRIRFFISSFSVIMAVQLDNAVLISR